MKPDYIIFLGLLISIAGAITAGTGTLLKSNASSRSSDSLKTEIATLKAQNEDLKGFATGGDSYVSIMIITLGNDRFKLLITLNGKYPLSDVKMWYIDMNGYEKKTNAEAAKYMDESQNNTYTTLGNFFPRAGGQELAQIFTFDKKIGVYLIFHFFANNGTPTEIIRGKWVEGQWRFATKIIRGSNDEIIYNIDPIYPSRADKNATFNDFY